MLVTTHYLDEAEHCNRLAIIHRGQLVALGSSHELKQVFADRPILEVQSARPVETMAALDRLPDVEKTSIFGTAVHAVLKHGDVTADHVLSRPARRRARRAKRHLRDPVARRRVPRRRRSGRAGRVIATVRAVMVKEVRQICRDRRTLLILLFIPAFFLLLYGYALNFDIRNIGLAVDDRDGSTESRALVSAFINSGYFDYAGAVHSDAELDRLIDTNDARAALVIPDGYGRDLARRRAGARAGDRQRRQRQHGLGRGQLRHGDRAGGRRAAAGHDAGRAGRRASSASSRASGTTRSSAARSSWCPASSPTSR